MNEQVKSEVSHKTRQLDGRQCGCTHGCTVLVVVSVPSQFSRIMDVTGYFLQVPSLASSFVAVFLTSCSVCGRRPSCGPQSWKCRSSKHTFLLASRRCRSHRTDHCGSSPLAASKSVVALLLLFAGIVWLTPTTQIVDLLLNGVALEHVMDIGQLIYDVFVPVTFDFLSTDDMQNSARNGATGRHFTSRGVTMQYFYFYLDLDLCPLTFEH